MMRRFELVIHECPGAVGVVADARGDFPLVEQDLAHPGKTCRVIVAPGKFRFEQDAEIQRLYIGCTARIVLAGQGTET